SRYAVRPFEIDSLAKGIGFFRARASSIVSGLSTFTTGPSALDTTQSADRTTPRLIQKGRIAVIKNFQFPGSFPGAPPCIRHTWRRAKNPGITHLPSVRAGALRTHSHHPARRLAATGCHFSRNRSHEPSQDRCADAPGAPAPRNDADKQPARAASWARLIPAAANRSTSGRLSLRPAGWKRPAGSATEP